MADFESTLVVETDAKKDFRLPHTRQMILVGTAFAIQACPFAKYLYAYDKSFVAYQLAPFKVVRAFEYGGDVVDMVVVRNKMAILAKDSIVISSRDGSRVIAGEFDGKLSQVGGDLGVQGRSRLSVYSLETLELLGVHEANAHYSIRDVLITSLDQEVSLYRRGAKVLEISMPGRISRLCTDPLLTNIYCGAHDGKIFCCSMNYKDPTTMVYHKSRIVGLEVSFCGGYLYSADAEGVVCIWDTRTNVVVGKVNMESEIRGMQMVYVSEWQGNLDAVPSELVGPTG